MKTLNFAFTAVVALLVAGTISAQTTMQRLSLVEQVTSASCGPCASQNPAFNALINTNYSDVAMIKYQRGGGGYIDPMWDFNPNEVDSRITGFYGVNSFPHVWINGEDESVPATIDQTVLDNHNASPATYHIAVDAQLINSNSDIQIDATITALQDYQSPSHAQNKVFVAVIEKDVSYASAPGTNGETDFFWVMRKMMPDQNGTTVGKRFAGESDSFNFTYNIDPNEIDPLNLDVLVWVQSGFSEEVYQAHRWSLGAVNNPLGMENSQILSQVSIYPTVANTQVNLALTLVKAGNANIRIVDAIGREVENSNMALMSGYQLKTIDVSTLPNGIYFASVQSGGQLITKKFVVSR